MTDELHRYDETRANAIETRWQEEWDKRGSFKQPNPGEAGFDASKPKFYCLDMFPYPSGAGLHVGHPEGYTATDILCRYKRMRGFNVLHPMGWDAFGLPAEQYAIKTGVHPEITTKKAIDNFRRQLKRFGFSYDWSREFGTIDPDYYRFTQWIFLRMYGAWFDTEAKKARPIAELEQEFAEGKREIRVNPRAASREEPRVSSDWAKLPADTKRTIVDSYRLAYVGEQIVNWCPKLGTALANEEVIDGRSERGSFPVFRKPLKQWMFRITAYCDRLLEGLETVDWPESTCIKQRDWIGRSEGAEIDFALEKRVGEHVSLRVYTTRPDTVFGATYMVVAPEHPLVADVLKARPSRDLATYVDTAKNRSELDRQQSKEKTGVALGISAINTATGAPIPIFTADYVLMGYGHGAIMAVPAHDERDHEFAEVHGLPIVQVVQPEKPVEGCFSGEGRAIHSRNDEVSLDGLSTPDAKKKITEWLEKKELGQKKVNYKLRDWLFSRQRYWGEPFPIVWDAEGHPHAVDDSALPVVLPPLADYQPEESDDPKPLLAKATDWVNTTAGAAGVSSLPPDAPVTRETNTMPGWAGSCWYYLRFCDPKNTERFASERAEKYWMGDKGVDLYVGGGEHAVLHLLYARFWHKVLFDLGFVGTDEPFAKLFHQGLITSHAYQRPDRSLVAVDEVDPETSIERATGEKVVRIVAKMSKSLKNVVNPDEVIASFGADTFRLYEMFMGPLDASKPWNPRDITGLFRFLQRTYRLAVDETTGESVKLRDAADPSVEKLLHRVIAKVESDIERLAFNTAIATMTGFVNEATTKGVTKEQLERFLRVLSPFAPHLAEELGSRIAPGTMISERAWPTYDEAMLRDAEIELPVQIKGKVRGRVMVPADADAQALEALVMADETVKGLLAGQSIKKVIVVPGKLVNIVTG